VKYNTIIVEKSSLYVKLGNKSQKDFLKVQQSQVPSNDLYYIGIETESPS
jgi:hypothetical protein